MKTKKKKVARHVEILPPLYAGTAIDFVVYYGNSPIKMQTAPASVKREFMQFISGRLGIPYDDAAATAPSVIDSDIDHQAGQIVRSLYIDRSNSHLVRCGDPLSTPTIKAPITQERIDKAFDRDPDGTKAMAQILKKAQRHL